MFLKSTVHFLVLLGLLLAGMQTVAAQSSSFTYQGQLQDGGSPATGSYDLQFRLYDELVGGSQVGSTQVVENVAVATGIFTVALDFGAASFPGADRFIEISVRPGASAEEFTPLTPLQQVATTPYALQSLNAQNSLQLGDIAANQYVLTGDSRLSDARAPTAGSSSYIQNTTSPQASSNFNISGNGVVGGSLTASGAVNGSGVSGVVAGGGAIGVQGTSPDGIGVRGSSTNSVGVLGSTTSGNIGVWGLTLGTTGTTYGVAGSSSSSSGTGVRGEASSATGSTSGVVGHTSSTGGTGVRGEAFGATGTTYGVDGESDSTSGIGVRGYAPSSTGTTYGVYGLNLSSSGIGVRGFANSLTGATQGVYGLSSSNGGIGVQGFASNASGTTYGVNGQSVSGSGVGVGGFVSSVTGATIGVNGDSVSSSGTGIRGQALSGGGTTYGVYGQSFSSSGVGVFGTGTTGVRGETPTTTGFGVAGINNGGGSSVSWGIYGQNTSSGGYAIEGYNPNGIGVRGNGGIYAGQFIGNVQIQGTLSKTAGSFQIDHPLDPANKYLFHSFVESPDMKNIYDGVVTLDDNGQAWVELPAYFEALNRDFRYQLTALGSAAPNLHIAEQIADNQFLIAGGAPQQEISWQVTGTRQDAYAEAHPIEVEVEKPEAERGKYLYPELYGQPESKVINAPTRAIQAPSKPGETTTHQRQ